MAVVYLLFSLIVWGFTVYGFWVGAPKLVRAFSQWVDSVDSWMKRRD